jgi:hypothetical protein
MEKIKIHSAQGAPNYWNLDGYAGSNWGAADRIAHHTFAGGQVKRQPSASTVISEHGN